MCAGPALLTRRAVVPAVASRVNLIRYEILVATQSDEASRQIAEYEAGPMGSGPAQEMTRFLSLSRKLYLADLKELEVASTIVFFRQQGADWVAAVEKTCQFKNLPPSTPFLKKCEALAKEIVA